MAYGSQSRTVQESVAPYWKSVGVSVDTAADTCRAIVNETSATLPTVTLTLASGSTITMDILAGVIYPLACTKSSSASVSFLY